ncbi:hypothetical protein L596_002916 [Steinernema carpocapsae]|nr:hypothetical protein L596_002916 [Steinernema carpocapsae]
MMILDVGFNTAAIVLSRYHSILLMLYILQDTNILMALIVMLISFSSTFIFQAGLISLLLKRFTPSIIVSLLYLIFTVAFHIISLRGDETLRNTNVWNIGVMVLNVLQKLSGILFYFFYKRTCLLLSDPRYHHDSAWLRSKIQHSEMTQTQIHD